LCFRSISANECSNPITLVQHLADREIAYEVVPYPHSKTALDTAAASGVAADRVGRSGPARAISAVEPAWC